MKERWLTIECFLDVFIFANDECCSTLGVFYKSQLVEISLPLEKEVNCFWMAIVTCIMQWSPLSIIKGHDVCSWLQQQLDALLWSLFAGKMKWCAVQFVFGFHIGSLLQKTMANSVMVVHSSEMKRSFELVWKSIEVGSCFKQLVNRLDISIVSSVVECCPAIWVNDVDVCIHLENGLKSLSLFTLTLVAENSFMHWCLSGNRCSFIDIFSTVYQVCEVFDVWLGSCFV